MSVINACVDWSATCHATDVMQKMMAASSYWQPEQSTTIELRQNTVTLGRQALFNTPQSHHEGILQSTDATFTITAHARLDNRTALFAELLPNCQPDDNTPDSQLILLAYRRWGEDCPKHLLGDFAFIIWDEPRQQLFCARDHMGIKVLYYSQAGATTLVSNEHKALVDTGLIDPTLDEQWMLRQCLHIGAEHGSPYLHIHTLPAAHSLTVTRNQLSLKRYWQLEVQDISHLKTEEQFLAELKQRFHRAVERRLVSNYPIGSELSEGLDSCGITGVAAKTLNPKTVHTFSHQCIAETDENSAVWGETYKDIYAMLAMHDNLQPAWAQKPLKHDQQAHAARFGGPVPSNGGGFLRPDLTQERGIRTLLTGWGGDHCVTSYGDGREDELFRQGKLGQLYTLLKQKRRRGRGITPWKGMIVLPLKYFAPPLHRRLIVNRYALTGMMWQALRKTSIRPVWLRNTDLGQKADAFIANYDPNSVRDRDYRELFTVGVQKRVTDSELLARAARLEYRFPMLDVELLELAYSAPTKLKVKNGVERHMYREIIRDLTTERIRMRVKADVAFPAFDRAAKTQGRRHAAIAALKASYHPELDRYFDRSRLLDEKSLHGPLGMHSILLQVSQAISNGTLKLPTR